MNLRVIVPTLAALCAALPVRGQQVRVTGVVRDSMGVPVGGALVAVDLGLRGMTFTKPDGRFELPRPVARTSWLRILHPANDVIDTLVSTLGPATGDGRGVFASVTLRNRPLDSVPVSADPPFRITSRAPDDVELELVDRAARLPRLRPSSGHREIRAYVHGRDGVLVLRRRGGHVAGEVWLWWIVGPRSGLFEIIDIRLRAAAYGCGTVPFHWATVPEDSGRTWRLVLACRPPFSTTPDWQGLWSRLDSLDVWRLSDETFYQRGGPPLVGEMPGSVVSLRLFDGQHYRLTRVGDRVYKTTPWGMRGVAIQSAVNDAFAALLLRPSRMERPVYTVGIRGIVRDTAGHPLAGALVTVPALPTSARTGDDGRFQLQHPVPWSVFIGVQHPDHQGVSYRVGGLPGQSYDSLGYETTIVLRPAGDRDSVWRYRSWPRCAEWDAFADRVAGSLVDVPEARLVTDPAVCAMAGMAYAKAERDPTLSDGRPIQRGDIALGMHVYVFRVNGGYVVFDEYNRVNGSSIGWAFDGRLQKPWKRRKVAPQAERARQQQAQWCAAAEDSLRAGALGQSYYRAIATLVTCPVGGPRALAEQWARPPRDTTALRLLGGVSATVPDRRILQAAKSAALKVSNDRDVRLAAIRALVGQFDPSIAVVYRTPFVRGVRGEPYVVLGEWAHQRDHAGADALPASARGEILDVLRHLAETDGDEVLRKVAAYLSERLPSFMERK